MISHDDTNGVAPIGDDDDFQFQDEDFDSEDETTRRFAVISVSKKRLQEYDAKLATMLQTESSPEIRRHIVRALGNIGSRVSIPLLIEMLKKEKGLIVGDVIRSLGQLKANEACAIIEPLKNSDLEWVANNSRWFLKRMTKETS